MTLPRPILALLLAVLALLSPSVVVGFGALAGTSAVVVASAGGDDSEEPIYRPCEKQGGKRVLPCPPDLGLLPAHAEAPAWAIVPASFGTTLLLHPGRVPGTDPPPPRGA